MPPTTATKPQLRIQAEQLTFEPSTPGLELEGDVVLQSGRYWVFSERLRLTWPRAGLELEGPAWLTLCPCTPAPARLRFESLTLSPSGSVELSRPVLELGGVPVLWAPWLRIEPPHHFGLLPIEVAWRGQDGAFLGAGLHAPLDSDATYLQARAGTYTSGGFGFSISATTPSSASWARWDQLDGTGLWLDLRGTASASPALGVAWTLDAIRGARGVAGTLPLGPAALSSDRARVSLGGHVAGLGYGLGLRADTGRGGPLSSIDAIGPELTLSYSAAVNEWTTLDLAVGLKRLYTPAQSLSLVTQTGSLELAHPIDVLAVMGGVQVDGDARMGDGGWLGGRVKGHLRLGLPLVRRSTSALRTEHWIEPFIEVTALGVRTSGRPDLGYFAEVREGEDTGGSAGVLTRYGVPRRREALALELEGVAGKRGSQWRSALHWRGKADAALVRLSTEGLLAPNGRQWLVGTRMEVGQPDVLTLAAYVDGQSASEPRAAPLLDRRDEHRLWTGWFSAAGWSAGGELRVPVGQHWRLAFATDADPTNERWLASAASAQYLARCRCLSISANLQRRLGRGGVDAAVSVDFMPR